MSTSLTRGNGSMIYELSLIPILSAFLLLAVLKRESKFIKIIALVGSATPLAFVPFMLQSIGSTVSINWLSLGSASFPITFSLLPINVLLFTIVSIVGPLVVLYSMGYMDKRSEDKSFYIELLAFEASMLAFSISGNFIIVLMAWGFLSLTSYLLIGFYGKKESVRAARETVTIILIGDIAMLIGVMLLWHTFSTMQFSTILSQMQSNTVSLDAQVGLLLILVAAFTKSAQFPFSAWLPAAMEGPTPVSSFLHSSTMVKAGVFIVIILFGMFRAANLLPLILVIGIISALLALSNALYETHIKRILAYSTIEELSLMFVALGLGAFSVALYIFIVQTFYKALLFFYSGILIKANSTEDIYQMRNAFGNRPLAVAGLIGVISLSGFIPFSGFFSNLSLESVAMSSSTIIYLLILLIDLTVSLMITRWFLVPSASEAKKKLSAKRTVSYYMVSKYMYASLYLMALLTLISTLAIVYVSDIGSSLSAYGYSINSTVTLDPIEAVVATVIVVIGLVAGYYLSKKQHNDSNPMSHLLFNNALFDKLYYYCAAFFFQVSVVFSNMDMIVSDVLDGIGVDTSYGSSVIRKVQSGQISTYALVFIAGMLVTLVYLILKV